MKQLIFILSLLLILSSLELYALKNPAATYCTSMGYDYILEKSDGYCQIPATKDTFPEWDFYKGKIGKEFSYCVIKGFAIKTIEDPVLCAPTSDTVCAVCVIDGKEVPIFSAMSLSLAEEPCGDSKCSGLENYRTCPKDCLSGNADGVCDEFVDGNCDPDCSKMMVIPGIAPPHDSDCDPEPVKNVSINPVINPTIEDKTPISKVLVILLAIAGLVLIGIVIYYVKKKN